MACRAPQQSVGLDSESPGPPNRSRGYSLDYSYTAQHYYPKVADKPEALHEPPPQLELRIRRYHTAFSSDTTFPVRFSAPLSSRTFLAWKSHEEWEQIVK